MTTAETIEFERQLALRSWTYDPSSQEFRDGDRLLLWHEVAALVPGESEDGRLDELAPYEDGRAYKLMGKRQRGST